MNNMNPWYPRYPQIAGLWMVIPSPNTKNMEVPYFSYPLVNQHNYGKSQSLLGKLTISMAMFNSYVTNYQRLLSPMENPMENPMEILG